MATSLFSISPECSICYESFKTPKVLPCGHTFCLDCLHRYIGHKTKTFPCPICGQNVRIPRGGANKFTTNFILQSSPQTPQGTGTASQTSHSTGTSSQIPHSTGTSSQIPHVLDQPSSTVQHNCPNHGNRGVDYYCETCSVGLCSKCIYRDHKDHKTLDVESVSTREMVVEELSKSRHGIKNKLEELEKTHATLVKTSEKLKTLSVEALKKVTETTEKIIRELKENCKKTKNEIQNHFDRNESQLTETKQKVMTQIKNIKTDLDTYSPSTTEEPSLDLKKSLSKLKDLQILCNCMKSDVPLVTYVEWKESNVKVCDILGSTVTKTLYEFIEGNVYTFNYKDIERGVYESKDQYKSDNMVWGCRVWRYNRCLYIDIQLLPDDNQHINYCNINYTLTLINKDKDKNVISETRTERFIPECGWSSSANITWDELTDQSEGFIDNEGQFLVRFDILQVIDIKYK